MRVGREGKGRASARPSKKPFANFKNALIQMGDLRDKWFAFHKEELRALAGEWLKSQDVGAKLI